MSASVLHSFFIQKVKSLAPTPFLPSDMVQRLGSIDVQKGNYVINFDRIGIADRIIDNPKVNNIEVESGSHPTNSHSDLDTKKVWEQFND